MKKTLVLSLIACVCAFHAAPSHADVDIDFTTAQGYTDGDLDGQVGWDRIYGDEPCWAVNDAAGVGYACPSNSGADYVSTAAGLPGFSSNSSLVGFTCSYTLVEYTGGTPWFTNFGFWVGDRWGAQDFEVTIRQDGYIEVMCGDGPIRTDVGDGDRYVYGVINYADDTFSVYSDTGTDIMGGETELPFRANSAQETYIRLQASNPFWDLAGFDRIQMSIIPEPASFALFGLLGLAVIRRR